MMVVSTRRAEIRRGARLQPGLSRRHYGRGDAHLVERGGPPRGDRSYARSSRADQGKSAPWGARARPSASWTLDDGAGRLRSGRVMKLQTRMAMTIRSRLTVGTAERHERSARAFEKEIALNPTLRSCAWKRGMRLAPILAASRKCDRRCRRRSREARPIRECMSSRAVAPIDVRRAAASRLERAARTGGASVLAQSDVSLQDRLQRETEIRVNLDPEIAGRSKHLDDCSRPCRA